MRFWRSFAEIGFSQRRWGYGMDVILHVRPNCNILLNINYLARTRSIESTEKVEKRDFEPLETADYG